MRWDTLEARLARAHEAVAGRPVAQPLPRMCQAAQSCQARPEEAQRASWGAANGALRPCCLAVGEVAVAAHMAVVDDGTAVERASLQQRGAVRGAACEAL